jgi:zinc protease
MRVNASPQVFWSSAHSRVLDVESGQATLRKGLNTVTSFRRVHQALASAVCLAILTTVPAHAGDRQPQIPELKVEKYRLPNGLDVILLEDHPAPIVAVNIWYKVGSKNETRWHTGLAHLTEHLMLEGSEHHNRRFFAPLEQLGARVGGTTDLHRTNYFETLPANGLELAPWLESDRMGYLLPALTHAKLKRAVAVVKNERRQRGFRGHHMQLLTGVPYGVP